MWIIFLFEAHLMLMYSSNFHFAVEHSFKNSNFKNIYLAKQQCRNPCCLATDLTIKKTALNSFMDRVQENQLLRQTKD